MGYTYLHAAIGDYSRVAYVEAHDDETAATLVGFWRRTQGWFWSNGMPIDEALTDNGPNFVSDAFAEVLAFAAFPRAHWQKIWSTNPLERINKEIKRRSRVVGIFPNEASAIGLVGAILADLHAEWQAS